MTNSTVFANQQTVVYAAWLNDVNAVTFENSFNVKQYGAIGDGTTDDSAAFTAAFSALRDAVDAADGGSYTLFIPPGKYRINTSIDATMINPGTNGPKILVSGYGADINGYCSGKPVFDAVGSAHISWEGLYVEGISGSEPVSAFQIGRYADGVTASNNSFRNVKTWGYFTRTAVHNLASEQNQYLHCSFGIRGTATAGTFSTYNTGNTQFAMIFDGINYFGATSDYVDMSGLTQYTAQSFLNNSLLNCSFRGGQSGDVGGGLLLMAVDSFRTQDCYAVGRGGWPGTVVGVYSGNNSNGVTLDLHSETSDSGDLGYCVYFKDMDNTASQINCEEFNFTEVSVHAAEAIIGTNLASSVVLLNNAMFNIGGFQSGAPDLLPLFDTPARYRVSGEIFWTRGASFQGTAMDQFTGEIWAKLSKSTVTVSNSGGDALFTYSGADWWTTGNKVQLTTTGTMPTGFTAGTVYYVVSPDTGANTFKLSATDGGAAIAYTDAGLGTLTVRIDFQHPDTPSAYTIFDMSDRTINYYGDQVTVQSININAGALVSRTTNGASLNTIELGTNKIMLQSMDFDATTQEYAQFRFTMPKGWDGGPFRYRIYWSHAATTTNFGVAWSLAARGFGNGDALDAAMGTAMIVTDTGGTTNYEYITAESDGVIPAGSTANEEELVLEVSRATGNAGDTLAVDARLHSILIKYTSNRMSDE